MTNRHEIEALADAMEQYAIKRDSMGFVPNFSIEGKEKILQVAAALRSHTPYVAMREALEPFLKAARIIERRPDDYGEKRVAAFGGLADAHDLYPRNFMRLLSALSALEAKAGEPYGYLYAFDGCNEVSFSRERKSEYMRKEPWTEMPLYTHPTPPQVDREAVAQDAQPRVTDNDRDEITVTLDGRELRGWSYSTDQEQRTKMLCAREFVEGFCTGRQP